MKDFDYHFNYDLKVSRNKYLGKGLVGLTNLGNTCFMNSVLQCFSNTLKLTDFFISTTYKKDISSKTLKKFEHYMVMSFYAVLCGIWESNENIITPKSFKENLYKFVSKFHGNEEQDSHECLLYILDLLHKGLSYEIEVDISGEIQSKTDKLMKDSMETWKKHYQDSYSIFIELFYGQFHGMIKCSDCEYDSSSFDPFSTIQLPISNTDCTLDECLKKFFNSENEEDTGLKCEKCKCVTMKRKMNFWKLPDILVIQLKRFTNNNTKITSKVDFPLESLDLTEYVSSERGDQNKYVYNLYAINCHQGGTNGGHYYAKCKNLNNSWYIYNDENVSKYLNNNSLVTNDAYLLFYHRVFLK
jgi:ubiquitin carboxyl-terminal hydrolase 8